MSDQHQCRTATCVASDHAFENPPKFWGLPPRPVSPLPASQGIDATLAERGERYGSFGSQAQITQNLKEVFHDSPRWNLIADDMKEALEMIASKIARILNGDPSYDDNWHDIVGYARLIEKRLEKEIV